MLQRPARDWRPLGRPTAPVSFNNQASDGYRKNWRSAAVNIGAKALQPSTHSERKTQMSRLTPFILGAAVVTALSLSPIDFGPLPIPAGVKTAEAAPTINIDVFFSPLASHGVWVKHPKYHYVFCPKVDA